MSGPEILNPAIGMSQYELLVLLDAAHGSLRVLDDGSIWRWGADQRRRVLESIYNRLDAAVAEPGEGSAD